MSQKITKNLQLNFLLTIVIGILNFILNKSFAKYMGVDLLGLMKLFTQMIAYLSLIDLGINSASSYALYKPLKDKDIKKINIIISTINFFYKRIADLILIIGILLSFLLPYFVNIDYFGNGMYKYWILYVVNTSLSYRFAKYSILFLANQEFGFVRKIQGTGKIIIQILQILSLIIIKSFVIFIALMILENLYSYYFYKKHYKSKYNYISMVKEKDYSILKNMKYLFCHKIAGLIVGNTDYIILSKFISLAIVGIYSSYLLVSQMMGTLINILTVVISPQIGAFIANNSRNEIYKYWRKLYSIYMYVATIFIICMYNLIDPFMNLWLGKNFLLPKMTVYLLMINIFINLIRGVTDIFKENSGFFNDVYAPLLEGGINLVISLILVQKLGLNGVILGTITSNILIILLLKPILVFQRCFEKKAIEYIKDFSKMLGISIFSGFIALKLLKKLKVDFFHILLWNEFIYKAIILGIVVSGVVTIVFLIDKNFRNFLLKDLKKIFF